MPKDEVLVALQRALRREMERRLIACVDMPTNKAVTLYFNDGTRMTISSETPLLFTPVSNGGD